MSPELSALSFRDLGYLVALAREGHFGLAADSCSITQPTLSAQVKKVEQTLGVRIFDRGHRRVRLTEIGRRIVEQARVVLDEAEKIKLLAKSRDPLSGELSLGVLGTIGPYLLPYVLPTLESSFPDLQLYIVEGTTARLATELRKGQIDLLIASPSPLLAEFGELHSFFEPFVLCTNGTGPLATRKRLRLGDLEDLKMLHMGPDHCLGDQSLGFCATGGAKSEAFQAASLETLRLLVAAGRGAALIPKLAVHGIGISPRGMLYYVPFREKDVGREITIYHRPNSPFGQDADILARMIADCVAM